LEEKTSVPRGGSKGDRGPEDAFLPVSSVGVGVGAGVDVSTSTGFHVGVVGVRPPTMPLAT
jgi:hypothetical protein